MRWTLRMRITSAAVTAYIALTEYLLVAVPTGLFAWLDGLAGVGRIVTVGLAGAALWAAAIVTAGHIQALSLPRHLRRNLS